MHSVKRTICLAIVAFPANAQAAGYVLGLGAEGDFGIGENTWLCVDISTPHCRPLTNRS